MNSHAGKKAREYFETPGLSVSEFARRLHCHRLNIYGIFKREAIDMGLMTESDSR